jgi:hypothetical protein
MICDGPLTTPPVMSQRARALAGASGAVVPIVIGLAATDRMALGPSATFGVLLGYGIRVAVLIALGAAAASLHRRTTTAFTLFELGIVGPALAILLMMASGATGGGGREPLLQTLSSPPETTIDSFATRPEALPQQLWRGVTAVRSRARWFVVLDNTPRAEQEARVIVQELRVRYGVAARIYGAGGPKRGEWSIVLGEWMAEGPAYARSRSLDSLGVVAFPWYLPLK